jgi:hypothetical protein
MTFTERCRAYIEAREKLRLVIDEAPREEVLKHWQQLKDCPMREVIRDRILWLEGGDYEDKTEDDIKLIAAARLILKAQ